jgi:hypothetical protein
MRYQDQVAVEATVAQAAWGRLFRAAMDAIEDCFARRGTRVTASGMVTGLLMEVDTRNCWTLAEALGHPGPHRLNRPGSNGDSIPCKDLSHGPSLFLPA